MLRNCGTCIRFESGAMPYIKTCPVFERLSFAGQEKALTVGVDGCILFRAKKRQFTNKTDQHKRFVDAVRRANERIRS